MNKPNYIIFFVTCLLVILVFLINIKNQKELPKEYPIEILWCEGTMDGNTVWERFLIFKQVDNFIYGRYDGNPRNVWFDINIMECMEVPEGVED